MNIAELRNRLEAIQMILSKPEQEVRKKLKLL